jgi:hypothetical protein
MTYWHIEKSLKQPSNRIATTELRQSFDPMTLCRPVPVEGEGAYSPLFICNRATALQVGGA